MRKIWMIFWHDAKQILKNVVAIVIMIGLVCLPCIYCWTNLLSSWSPYSDLQAIKIGIYSEDQGATVGDITLNVGDLVIKSLRQNKTVGWVFYNDSLPDDASDEAKEDMGDTVVSKVEKGDVYAAFIIPADFSGDLVGFIKGELQHPTIAYYENQKKNAIVPKITSKVKTTVQNQVNESIISSASEALMSASNYLAGNGAEATDAAKNALMQLDSDLTTYMSILNSFISLTQSAETLLSSAEEMIPDMDSMVGDGTDTIRRMQDALLRGNNTVNDATTTIEVAFYGIELQLLQLQNLASQDLGAFEHIASTVQSDVKIIQTNLNVMSTILEGMKNLDKGTSELNPELENLIPQTTGTDAIKDITDHINGGGSGTAAPNYDEMQEKISLIETDLTDLSNLANTVSDDADGMQKQLVDKINVCIQDFEAMKSVYQDSMKNAIQSTSNSLYNSLMKATLILGSVDVDFDSLTDSLNQYAGILNDGTAALTESLSQAQTLHDKLGELLNYFEELGNNKEYQSLIEMFKDDPAKFADFISEPTGVTKKIFYEVSDDSGNAYATSMSSFYTVLALYLSSLFCMVVIHAKIKRKQYTEIKGRISMVQAYFGRWTIFAGISILTSIIIALGNLLFIEIQCKHPLAYILSVVVIGLVFNFFSYSCAFGLGVVGEALALICMIVSVACSSSFPIELLPPIFGTMNHYNMILFQPGMNMLKETIAGYHAVDYWIFLLEDLAYVAVAMAIALGISRIPPVRWLCELLEKRKNDSHVII